MPIGQFGLISPMEYSPSERSKPQCHGVAMDGVLSEPQ
jgi:hypothetical protein